jgi:hypothetical protein
MDIREIVSSKGPNGAAAAAAAAANGTAQDLHLLTKAIPCSTCGKGFARRSDQKRHGKVFFQPAPFFSSLIYNQNESTAVFDLMFASTLVVAKNSFRAVP